MFPLRKVVLDNHYSSVIDWKWAGSEYLQPSLLGTDKVKFLNLAARIESAQDWNDPSKDKLWLYNLHYFDDLNALDNSLRFDIQHSFIKRWIKENPPVLGNGWEPYPISLRLVNWIKWYTRSDIDDSSIVFSIAQQTQALTKQLEYHILGNHLFANAKALVFAGCFLEGKEAESFLQEGLNILAREVPEQFLADGGHFELSPMYHCILLWDLLDLINLALVTHKNELINQLTEWRQVAARALNWLQVMQHSDGDISFFNDSTIGIAASPSQIYNYALSLGLKPEIPSLPKLVTLKDSGYSRVTFPRHNLLFDHAAVGPDYLPGHAHADTLSVEWCVDKQRVLVNSGTSMYGISKERHRQRQTPAHNTVQVDNLDSSEVWSGFRVAKRAYATLIRATSETRKVTLVASHDGYKRLKGDVTHAREIVVEEHMLNIFDRLDGVFNSAKVYWHIHPEIQIKQLSAVSMELTFGNGRKIKMNSDSDLHIRPSTWHPGFGKTISSFVIVAEFGKSTLNTSFLIV